MCRGVLLSQPAQTREVREVCRVARDLGLGTKSKQLYPIPRSYRTGIWKHHQRISYLSHISSDSLMAGYSKSLFEQENKNTEVSFSVQTSLM
jgi:hypothetical protein